MKTKPISKLKKVWSSNRADTVFSSFIRERDGACVRCGRKDQLQCSHFWGRGNSATRYDPDNCDALCYACHYGNVRGWEYNKQGEYREFKINQLGEGRYKALEVKAKSTVKRRDAILAFMELYEKEGSKDINSNHLNNSV